MDASTESFPSRARKALEELNLTSTAAAMDLNEPPAHIHQLLAGYRPHYRLRQKLARYLHIDISDDEAMPLALRLALKFRGSRR